MTDLLKERAREAKVVEDFSLNQKPRSTLNFPLQTQAPSLAILVNVSAGAYRFFGHLRLKRAMRAAGLEESVPLIRCFGHELHDKALALVRSGVRAIGVFGGDGSARTVALALRGLDVPVLPLPGGTLNRLCHRVHGHAHLGKTLRDYKFAKPVWLPGGQANEHVFLVASGFGPWMAFQDMRETIRLHGLTEGFSALRTSRRDLFAGKLTTYGTGRRCDVVIAAPTFVDTAFGFGSRADDFQGHGLEMVQARLCGITPTLWLAANVVGRSWRGLAYTDSHVAEEHRIEIDGEEILGLVDGERRWFGRSVCLKSVPRAALVLSTRQTFE